VLALIATYLACFRDWRPFLGPGERGTIMIVAADRKQARTIKRFISGLLNGVPMLKPTIEEETKESVTLRNNVSIEIHTASFRSTRGYTIVCALCDELAFWPTDESSSEPDAEVLNALRPGMSTIPNAMLLCASSPYARRGTLWNAYNRHYGKNDSDVLVWQATTRDMNSSVPQKYIDQQIEDDPQRASAEYMGLFRSDLEAYVLRESVEACVSLGIRERAPLNDVSYVGFVDPSGGSSDSMTLCIAHLDFNKETVIIDCLREAKPPFSPEIVTSEFCAVLASYRIDSVQGDRYGGQWPTEQFAKYGVTYLPAEKTKSAIYTDMLPLVNSRRLDLLDHQKTINQLIGLERRTARGGASSIDHAPGQHDDLINVIGGACSICIVQGIYNLAAMSDSMPDDPHGIEGWRSMRRSFYYHSGGRIIL
jgi:hypothetical protein